MTNGRNLAITTAAMACVLAAPLAIGSYPARADEVSDLRANQELLQQRLDQLAQAPRIQAPGGVYGRGGAGPTTVQMMGGSFPRSFLVPGTDTSIRVGGEVRMNVLYWLNGSPALGNSHQTNPGNTGTVNSAALSESGAARTRTDNVLHMSPAQSKINVETRTPTAWGEARTFIEFDFSNTTNVGARAFAIADNLALRMRFAYGTLGGLLAGQANSNFADPDAGVETISFGGLVGGPGHARVPQVRYTMPLAGWGLLGAFSIAAEHPDTAVWSPGQGLCSSYGDGATTCGSAGANILKSAAPDITAAWYIPQPWGHVDFSAVVRPTLRIEDGTGAIDKNYVGWGIYTGGDVKPRWFGWDRDFFTWQMIYGQAMGGYAAAGSGNSNITIVSNFNPVPAAGTTLVTAANAIFKPTTTFGGNIGYRHYWAPNLRSNIGVGIHHEDINGMNGAVCRDGAANAATRRAGTAGCGLNEELMTANINMVWNPVPFVGVAAEYFWGHRFTTGGQRGDENVLLTRFSVAF
jgi:hypothetical protein